MDSYVDVDIQNDPLVKKWVVFNTPVEGQDQALMIAVSPLGPQCEFTIKGATVKIIIGLSSVKYVYATKSSIILASDLPKNGRHG